ncbi:MAG: hypothetical protein RLZZ387_5545 [Chloroflexota bacterium]|jgi:diguanylate cyclase (GGDEF)-like protein
MPPLAQPISPQLSKLLRALRSAVLGALRAAQAGLARAERALAGGPRRPAPQRSLDALLQISLASVTTRDPDHTARAALDAVAVILGTERALLFWTSEVSGTLTLRAARAGGADIPEPAYSVALVERVRVEGRPLVLDAASDVRVLDAEGVKSPGPHGALAAPLYVAERLAGVVYVEGRGGSAVFTEEDVAILQAIANHVAVAIETARMALLEVHVAAEREQRRLAETLAAVTAALTTTLDLDEVLDRLLENLALVVPYDSAAVLLRENNHFRVVAARGHSDAVAVRRLILPAGDALLGEVIATHRPTVLADVRTDPRYIGYGGTDYTRSWMGLPLLAGEEVFGFLTLDSGKVGAYGEQESAIAFTFAGQAAIAIRNARLFGEVRRLAATDALTEVHNRHQFFVLAEQEWDAAQALSRPAAAIMVDIDHFKRVNDTYGHAAGDSVLRTVAQRCQAAVRDSDVLGRYGGEEFAVLLPNTGAEAALLVAERLRARIADTPITLDGGEIPVTVSVGVANAHAATRSLAALLDRADAALYAAKGAGRNRVVVG